MNLQAALIALSTLGTAALTILFLYRNAPGLENVGLFAGSGLLYLLGYGLTATACLRALGAQAAMCRGIAQPADDGHATGAAEH